MALWPKNGNVKAAAPSETPEQMMQRQMREQAMDALKYAMSPQIRANPIDWSMIPNALGAGTVLARQAPSLPSWSTSKLLELIHMRMHRDRPRDPGMELVPDFDFIAPYKNKETVVVFLVHNGQPTYIEDEWGLFPSDTLITKLRLLLG